MHELATHEASRVLNRSLVLIYVLFSLASPAMAGLVEQSTPAAQSPPPTIDVSLEHLRDVGLDLKQVLTATRHIYDEVTISPQQASSQPTVIGFAACIPLRIGPRIDGPPIPARKQRVDLAMTNLTSIIGLLKQNADDFVLNGTQLNVSSDTNTKLKPLINQWNTTVGYLAQDFAALQKLTAGPDYQNGAIADTCTSLQGDVKDLDKIRGKIATIIRDEQKRLTASH
jgi:hypothetical protein